MPAMLVMPALPMAPALLLPRSRVADRRAGFGADFGCPWCDAAGSVALIRGLARHGRRHEREAAERTGVVDLHVAAVVVAGDQLLPGEEVDIGAIGRDAEEAGAERRGPGR